MKTKALILYFLFLSIDLFSQSDILIITLELANKTTTQAISLTDNISFTKNLEGYFLITNTEEILHGEIKSGGFSFTDPAFFGNPFKKKLSQDLVKNFKDLEFYSNELDAKTIISFEIEPVFLTKNKDSVYLYCKYACFSLIQNKSNSQIKSYDYNLKTLYKSLKVPLNSSCIINDLSSLAPGFIFSIQVDSCGNNSSPLIENQLIMHHLNSNEYNLNLIKRFTVDLEFVKTDTLYFGFEPFFNTKKDFLYREAKMNISNSTLRFTDGCRGYKSNSFLVANFSFPFRFYKEKDIDVYKNYKTAPSVFKSNYSFIIAPVNISGDTLTADLYIETLKINVDDISRWTPIKKRITLIKNILLKVDLPKENWTANFVRGNEKYTIFGFSQYEQYVNESLFIKLKNIE